MLILALFLMLQAKKRFGVQVQVIPETSEGDINIEALQQMLAQQVGIINLINQMDVCLQPDSAESAVW